MQKDSCNAHLLTLAIISIAALTAIPVRAGRSQWAQVDSTRLLQADQEPENWMTPGRNYKEHHYSPLDQINTENVDNVGFAWEYDARNRRGHTPRGLEATPVAVDGVLYTSGAWGVVYALDAKTGEELWRYDPDVDASYARNACCDVVNRGVSVWKGRVYVATLDGYLVALNGQTGQKEWKVDTITDRSLPYTITGAPQIAADKVVIGNSGADFGARGYITAYDAETGDFAWRFFTVPGNPEEGFEHPEMKMAAKTWDPDSQWEAGLGGTVWGEMAYDPKLNLLYVGTGNAFPYPIQFRSPEGGDNLFLATILAINPDTGRLVWHYQTTPGEKWDYTATQHMILADLEINGTKRKVLMQAPKNGFFYVLDRKTGEFISAEPYVTVNWASHINPETGRPVLTEDGDYSEEAKLIFPSAAGGHNWQPMSYNPNTGLVYTPAIESPMILKAVEESDYRSGSGGVAIFELPPFSEDVIKDLGSKPKAGRWEERLLAWDPIKQQEVWSVPLASDYNGGVLSTGGNVVFQGTASGYLIAYNAKTGKKLRQIKVGTGIMAGPMTYSIKGQQYVAVMAGYGGAKLGIGYPEGSAALKYSNYGRILAFKLGGGTTPLPPKRTVPEEIPEPPKIKTKPAQAQKGKKLYGRSCARCHGAAKRDNRSGYPSLALLTPEKHQAFKSIVLDGSMSYSGMPSFGDQLSEEDVQAIQAFIVSRQRELRGEEEAN